MWKACSSTPSFLITASGCSAFHSWVPLRYHCQIIYSRSPPTPTPPHLLQSKSHRWLTVGGVVNLLIVAAVGEPLCSAPQQTHCLPCFLEQEERAIVRTAAYGAAARTTPVSPSLFLSQITFRSLGSRVCLSLFWVLWSFMLLSFLSLLVLPCYFSSLLVILILFVSCVKSFLRYFSFIKCLCLLIFVILFS